MKNFGTALLALTISLALAPSVMAQDEDDDAPTTKTKKKVDGPTCTGRNAALCKALGPVARKTSAYVVKVGDEAYGVILDGNIIVTTAGAAKGASVRVKGSSCSGTARVLGVDDSNAIALLECPQPAKGIEVVATSEVTIGQVLAICGSEETPVCAGVVSAKNRKVEPRDLSQANLLMGLLSDGIDGPKRSYPKVLQHDAPMTDEILGTAVVDVDGKLVGMNVGTGYRGSSYAIGTDELLAAAKAIRAGGGTVPKAEPKRPAKAEAKPAAGRAYFGASIQEKAGGGVSIVKLDPDGPAASAGFEVGDEIVSIDGNAVSSLQEVAEELGSKTPGKGVVVAIRRSGEKRTIAVTLGESK